MTQPKSFEIIETRYGPIRKATLVFQGTLEEAKEKALQSAAKQIGVRYAVFRQGSTVAEFQAYYRTTIECPNCGEIIPIE